MGWSVYYSLRLSRPLKQAELATLRQHNLDPRWATSARSEGYRLEPVKGSLELSGRTKIGGARDYRIIASALIEARTLFPALEALVWDDYDSTPMAPDALVDEAIAERTGESAESHARAQAELEAELESMSRKIDAELARFPEAKRKAMRRRLLERFRAELETDPEMVRAERAAMADLEAQIDASVAGLPPAQRERIRARLMAEFLESSPDEDEPQLQ